jgi:hypothetical protein
MKKLYLYLFLLANACAFAQGENDNWYFGYFTGLNFSTDPPTPLDGQSSSLEGTAVISDSAGQLLFYTDGVTVWNRQHQVMVNGTGLSGHNSSQQVIISPYPGNNHLYYVFTMAYVFNGGWGEPTDPGGISAYSVVDMTRGPLGINGLPLGEVIAETKNTPLLNELGQVFETRSENIAATPHADNKSYWILFPNGGKLYSYRLDDQGFHNTPLVSTMPTPIEPVQTHGHIRVSPNLPSNLGLSYTNLIAFSRWNGGLVFTPHNFGVRVASFDNNTGLLTNDYLLNITNIFPMSTEFSNKGDILYAAGYFGGEVRAYDLFNTSSPGLNRLLLNGVPFNGCGVMQRAANGEIYLNYNAPSTQPNYQHLGRITNQDSYSTSGVDLLGVFHDGSVTLGLPALVPILPTAECMANISLGFPETASVTRQVSSTITITGIYKVASGQDVNLKGGDYVLMLPNTTIEAGSVFLAEIEGCTASVGRPSTMAAGVPVKAKAAENVPKLTVYPNPASDIVTVSLPDSIITSITVYTKEGRKVYSRNAEGSAIKLDVSQYEKGVYLLTVTTLKGDMLTDKIIKE